MSTRDSDGTATAGAQRRSDGGARGEGMGFGEGAQESGPGETPRDEAGARRRLEHIVPDLVKRGLYAGLGALFSTEEGIRRIASDFSLPKDVANFLVTQAANSKDELLRIFARELRTFLENVNLSGELQKLLTQLSFEIKTEIRFIPNDEAVGGVKPNIKPGMTIKRSRKDKRADDPAEAQAAPPAGKPDPDEA